MVVIYVFIFSIWIYVVKKKGCYRKGKVMEEIKFSIMTYNVHSCLGKDRRSHPHRVGEVIMMYKPDIVALQEIDVDMDRSGKVHQARIIADYLNMAYHFHPVLFIKEGQYGNAILSPGFL